MRDKKSSRGDWFAGIVLALISGLLYSVSFPPVEFAPAIWFALVPLFVALMRFAPSKLAFGIYYGITLAVGLLGLLRDIPPGFEVIYATPVLIFVLIFLATFWQKNLLAKNNFRYFTVLTVTGFVAFEYARQFSVITLFAALGISQYRNPIVIQIASLFGVFGISFLIVLVNVTIALIITNTGSLGKVKTQIAINILLIALLMGLNIYLWNKPLNENGRIKVAAIQMGYVPEAKVHPGYERYDALEKKKDWPAAANAVIDVLKPLTEKSAGEDAKLVVWPETTLTVDPTKFVDIRNRLADMASQNGIFLVAPYYSIFPGQEKKDSFEYYNGAAVFSPEGKFIFRYLKQHMVKALGIEKGKEGRTSKVLATPMGKMAIMICYDADYPKIPNEYVSRGAEYFVTPSHDLSLFITRHHPALLMFRAVENHRSFIKADYVHGAMIVDPKGRILADAPNGLQYITAEIPLVSDKTPFSWLSHVFCLSCVVGFVFSIVVSAVQKDNKKS